MKLALRGTHLSHLGYGTLVQNLRRGLADVDGFMGWEPMEVLAPSDAETVLWASPPCLVGGGYKDQWHAAFTMWEATRLPESFYENLHWQDQVIVPCDQNVELFSHHHRNVTKVNLGYDSDVWQYTPRSEPTDEFRFLCAGAGLSLEGGRKGFDLAAKAFRLAFPKWETMSPRPVLVAKSLRWIVDGPFIECHAKEMALDELQALVAGCHAYIGPSRGEGWGYWPQQALATGMPAVISAIPAHMEFAHMPGFATVPVSYAPSGYFLHGYAGRWWEPDLDSLVDQMRDMYNRWSWWREQAAFGARQMANTLTYRHMVANLLDVLEAGRSGGEWQLFTRRLFETEVIRHVECDIGDTHFDLQPGVHQLYADPQRVLREAGFATVPADDDGLVPVP